MNNFAVFPKIIMSDHRNLWLGVSGQLKNELVNKTQLD